jgi:hypothetical protein
VWHWSRKPWIALKVLGRSGSYPSFTIRQPGHLYVPEPDLVWTAVLQPPLPDDWEVGEFTPLSPQQIALFSAIALCERDPWNNGYPVVTHGIDAYLDPETVGFDLSDPSVEATLRQFLADKSAAGEGLTSVWESQNVYTIRDVGAYDDALELLANIDTADELLLAGLARLLGACRLLSSPAQEIEEASISMFISMGAALEHLRQVLAGQNGAELPFSRVSEYLEETFPDGAGVADYFREMYETRVIATHPSSRFGDYWAIPLMVGDVYHFRKSMMILYRHIILGDIPDE